MLSRPIMHIFVRIVHYSPYTCLRGYVSFTYQNKRMTAAKKPSQIFQPTPVFSAIRSMRFIVPFRRTRVFEKPSFIFSASAVESLISSPMALVNCGRVSSLLCSSPGTDHRLPALISAPSHLSPRIADHSAPRARLRLHRCIAPSCSASRSCTCSCRRWNGNYLCLRKVDLANCSLVCCTDSEDSRSRRASATLSVAVIGSRFVRWSRRRSRQRGCCAYLQFKLKFERFKGLARPSCHAMALKSCRLEP